MFVINSKIQHPYLNQPIYGRLTPNGAALAERNVCSKFLLSDDFSDNLHKTEVVIYA
jgi:hypothetical protein